MSTSTVTSEVVPTPPFGATPAASVVTSQSPVFVPGYGWVRWSKPLLDAQARYLLLLHQPDQSWARFRLVSARRTADRPRCLYCGREWTCPEAVWAAAWLSPLVRVWGKPAKARGGRHRAPGQPRLSGGSSRRSGGRRGRRSAGEAVPAAHAS